MNKYLSLLGCQLQRWFPKLRLTLLCVGVFALSCTVGVLLRQATG
jgi:hypothetical protein